MRLFEHSAQFLAESGENAKAGGVDGADADVQLCRDLRRGLLFDDDFPAGAPCGLIEVPLHDGERSPQEVAAILDFPEGVRFRGLLEVATVGVEELHLGGTALSFAHQVEGDRFEPGANLVALEIDDPHVIDLLVQSGFVHYTTVPTLLPKRLAELETEALLAVGESAPARDATARRRQLAANPSVRSALPSLYWELDALQKHLPAGAFDPARLSVEARWALATPARDAEVLGHLIARFVRFAHATMAFHHRRIIGAEWERYSEAKRRYLAATFPYMIQGFVA